MQLERGRRNGFGGAVKQSALATAKKQYIRQTEVALNNFGIAIVKFALAAASVVRKSGERSIFKLKRSASAASLTESHRGEPC